MGKQLKRPPIPERFSSLVAQPHRRTMKESRARQVSYASNVSVSSNASDFLESKILHLSAQIEYLDAYKAGLLQKHQAQNAEDSEIRDEIQAIKEHLEKNNSECLSVKRQKKIIAEDLEEDQGSYQTVTDAYAALIVDKVMGACREDTATKKRRRRGFNASKFKSLVLDRYNAYADDTGFAWCHVLGDWFPKKYVKAAHIVPKSLESSELSYLFGVSEMPQMDPRNGLSLHAIIEEAVDRGDIAIIPIPPETREQVSHWKCVVVNETIKGNRFFSDKRWSDIDGEPLKFRGENRPARRYLYFRYLITYFHQKRFDNVKWADSLESKGHMWATPGPYLRRTMLEVLARKASDLVLPDLFWKMVPDTTFEQSESSPALSSNQEELNGTFLVLRCQEYMAKQEAKADDDDDDDTDDDDDDDEYDDDDIA